MNIALIANDSKKELMVAFCIAYKGILQSHNLIATGTTGSTIMEQTGLNINMCAPGLLGEQQIAARVAYNEIDLVIFLRDPIGPKSHEPDITLLLQHCDTNNIPFATNVATAEMLIKSLDRGDLAWRELINPSY
ncbi:MAG TPA: methylglyoxal synthase [Pseudobacteroides sp.]|uniref:methylglyoxal synthase n=1 Tax=Pseudobacteroides sp. TaxID=1968840 RepID=UPI002F93F540